MIITFGLTQTWKERSGVCEGENVLVGKYMMIKNFTPVTIPFLPH